MASATEELKKLVTLLEQEASYSHWAEKKGDHAIGKALKWALEALSRAEKLTPEIANRKEALDKMVASMISDKISSGFLEWLDKSGGKILGIPDQDSTIG